MIELQSTLDGETKVELKQGHIYTVDFSKMGSVNDLVIVLQCMGIGFPSDHPHIEMLKPFLNLDNPIPMQKPADFIPLKKVD